MTARACGWLLAVVTVAIVLANQSEVGIARDEQVYIEAGPRYFDWWASLFERLPSRDNITRTFGGPNATDNNREHPPLMKTAFGLSHRVLHRGFGVDELTAFRVPTAVTWGLLVLLVYGFVLTLWGTSEAVISALLVMFLPRGLFHAGLACFDAPITSLWFATIYAYWRAIAPPVPGRWWRRWPWGVGVVFGLALATKHNALLLPLALGIHYLVVGYRRGGWLAAVTHRWPVIVSLAVIAPLTLFVLWPWLWLDPIGHLKDWLEFHLDHTHYNFEYLGANYGAPPFPWHVPIVTTLVTVPVATLAGAAIGAVVWWVQRREVVHPDRLAGLLLVLSAGASIGPFFLGTTPIFGAEKHWMPALPSICIAAGVGTAWAARRLAALIPPGGTTNLWLRGAAALAVYGMVVGAAAVETATAQPYALSSYNALAGGDPGGADLGMNRQFWGVAVTGVLPVLRDQPPAPVYSHDASPAWGAYIKRGELPAAMRHSGQEEAGVAASKYALVIHELHFNRHDYLIWNAYGTVQPMFVLRAHGVPIVSLYKRPR